MKIKTNLVGGIFFIVLGTVLLLLMPNQIIVQANIPFLESAKAAPFIALLMLIVGGIILVIQSLVFKKEQIVTLDFAVQKHALTVMGIFIGYALSIYLFGFLIASFLLIAAMVWFFRIKSKIQIAVIVAISVAVYFIFINLFHISLPGIGGVFLS